MFQFSNCNILVTCICPIDSTTPRYQSSPLHWHLILSWWRLLKPGELYLLEHCLSSLVQYMLLISLIFVLSKVRSYWDDQWVTSNTTTEQTYWKYQVLPNYESCKPWMLQRSMININSKKKLTLPADMRINYSCLLLFWSASCWDWSIFCLGWGFHLWLYR